MRAEIDIQIVPCIHGGDHEKLVQSAMLSREEAGWPTEGAKTICLFCLAHLDLPA